MSDNALLKIRVRGIKQTNQDKILKTILYWFILCMWDDIIYGL